jgi:RNA polymerase sigma-B factor
MPAVTMHRSAPLDATTAPRTDAQLLAAFAETRDPQLREALVERFLPLARSIAKRYRKAEEPFDDLLQVASLGLLKAIRRFVASRSPASPSRRSSGSCAATSATAAGRFARRASCRSARWRSTSTAPS